MWIINGNIVCAGRPCKPLRSATGFALAKQFRT